MPVVSFVAGQDRRGFTANIPDNASRNTQIKIFDSNNRQIGSFSYEQLLVGGKGLLPYSLENAAFNTFAPIFESGLNSEQALQQRAWEQSQLPLGVGMSGGYTPQTTFARMQASGAIPKNAVFSGATPEGFSYSVGQAPVQSGTTMTWGIPIQRETQGGTTKDTSFVSQYFVPTKRQFTFQNIMAKGNQLQERNNALQAQVNAGIITPEQANQQFEQINLENAMLQETIRTYNSNQQQSFLQQQQAIQQQMRYPLSAQYPAQKNVFQIAGETGQAYGLGAKQFLGNAPIVSDIGYYSVGGLGFFSGAVGAASAKALQAISPQTRGEIYYGNIPVGTMSKKDIHNFALLINANYPTSNVQKIEEELILAQEAGLKQYPQSVSTFATNVARTGAEMAYLTPTFKIREKALQFGLTKGLETKFAVNLGKGLKTEFKGISPSLSKIGAKLTESETPMPTLFLKTTKPTTQRIVKSMGGTINRDIEQELSGMAVIEKKGGKELFAPVKIKTSIGLSSEQLPIKVGKELETKITNAAGIEFKELPKQWQNELRENFRGIQVKSSLGKTEISVGKYAEKPTLKGMKTTTFENTINYTLEPTSVPNKINISYPHETGKIEMFAPQKKPYPSDKIANIRLPTKKPSGTELKFSDTTIKYDMDLQSNLLEVKPATILEQATTKKGMQIFSAKEKAPIMIIRPTTIFESKGIGTVASTTKELTLESEKGAVFGGGGKFWTQMATPTGNVVSFEETKLTGKIITKQKPFMQIIAPNPNVTRTSLNKTFGFQIQKQAEIQAIPTPLPTEKIMQIVSTQAKTKTVLAPITYAVPGSAVQLAENLQTRTIKVVPGVSKNVQSFMPLETKTFLTSQSLNVFQPKNVQSTKIVQIQNLKPVSIQTQKGLQLNLQKNLQQEKQLLQPKEMQLEQQKNLQLNLQKNLQLNLQKNLQLNLQKNLQLNLQKNLQLNLQKQLQMQKQLQLQVQTPMQIQTPPPPTGVSKLHIAKPKKFVGITKAKGGKIFVLPQTESFGYQEAAGKTAGIIKNTLRASMKILPVSQTRGLPTLFQAARSTVQPSPQEFYLSKRGGWQVQRKTKTGPQTSRLGSPGERYEIALAKRNRVPSMAGWLKLKKKKK